jgi:hypothetical protein
MYDRVLETGRRWIESNEVAGLEGFRSGGSWRSLSGDNYAQGNAETIPSIVRITHMIAIGFNRGDPMHLRSSKNGLGWDTWPTGVFAGLRAVNNAAEGTALAEFACC